MTTVPSALEYAPPLPIHRRRWVRRAIALLTVGAVVAAGVRWGPIAWARAKLVYWQGQCLTYAPPADRVVYEDGPAGSPLVGTPGYAGVRNPSWAAHGVPQPATQPAAAYVPERWQRYESAVHGKSSGATPVPLFLHERVTKRGERRLVVVLYYPSPMAGFSQSVNLTTRAIRPGTWTEQPEGFWLGMITCSSYVRETGPRSMRVYAGQPDPADASRFTIRFVHNGTTREMAGTLVDEGIGGVPGVMLKMR